MSTYGYEDWAADREAMEGTIDAEREMRLRAEQEAEESARYDRRLRRSLRGALAASLLVLVGTNLAQIGARGKVVRAAERQAVRACDAAWSLCRFKVTGKSPEDAHACAWVEDDRPTNDPIFTNPAAGYYMACSFAPAPTDEPAEDESLCGQAWRVCQDLATAEPGAGR